MSPSESSISRVRAAMRRERDRRNAAAAAEPTAAVSSFIRRLGRAAPDQLMTPPYASASTTVPRTTR